MTQTGGVAASMQHPFNQVRDWLHVCEEQRLAVLDCIGLKREDVSKIRGVVILGREKNSKPDHLRKLKSNDFGKIEFFTYDDILRNMESLIRDIANL